MTQERVLIDKISNIIRRVRNLQSTGILKENASELLIKILIERELSYYTKEYLAANIKSYFSEKEEQDPIQFFLMNYESQRTKSYKS